MRTRLAKLAAPESAYRFVANELIGYAAFRVGDLAAARDAYQSVLSDLSAPQDLKDRVQIMLNEVQQRLPDAPPAKPASATAKAPPTTQTKP